MNPFEQEEWSAFLANAIGGLRLASSELKRSLPEYEAKRDWFRSSRSGIPRENSVTRALADLFSLIRSRQNIRGADNDPVDLRHISVECEKPRARDKGISDMANPTDMSIVFMKGSELDFRIEAKTVLNNAEIKREYLGPRGLDRFEDGENPYTIQPYGGMVAYVVDLDAESWSGKIATELEAKVGTSRTKSMIVGNSEHIVSIHEYELSTKDGPIRKHIDVVHLALEIDAKPPRR